MGLVAQSVVRGEGLAIPPGEFPEGFLFRGKDGRSYSKYGAGLSLVSVPHAALGLLLARAAPSSAVDLFDGPTDLWYSPRDPSTAWHFLAVGLVSALVAAAAWDGDGYPRFVEREFRRYLDCGLLCHGFARLREAGGLLVQGQALSELPRPAGGGTRRPGSWIIFCPRPATANGC